MRGNGAALANGRPPATARQRGRFAACPAEPGSETLASRVPPAQQGDPAGQCPEAGQRQPAHGQAVVGFC
jgi:hypothetical protein